MSGSSDPNNRRVEEILRDARDRPVEALSELMTIYRERLLRVIETRLDLRVRQRVDACDVLQEAAIVALKQLPKYLQNPSVKPFVWLRTLVYEQALTMNRRHLAQLRDPRRETPPVMAGSSSNPELVARLLGRGTSPSQAAIRLEMQAKLMALLDAMEPKDREVLELKHLEQLDIEELAQCLGINVAAARKRYYRALERLRRLWDDATAESESSDEH